MSLRLLSVIIIGGIVSYTLKKPKASKSAKIAAEQPEIV